MAKLAIRVNGKRHVVEATRDTPLLYVLRNELELRGPRFGCGLAQCGACTVQVDGEPIRSCVTPVSEADGKQVTTLEGLGSSEPSPGRVQKAFIEHQAAQCGYCTNGMIVAADAFLNDEPGPDRGRDQAGDEPVPLPLRHPLPDRRGDPGRREGAR